MPDALPTADRLFDRPWRPGHHPFGKCPSRMRKWAMLTLLVMLSSIIGGYLHYTDADRVRSMAQSYLSRILRGRIEIGAAKLSIFEGLRLQDVRVYVDPTDAAPDATLFTAEAFVLKYDPRVLITGRLEADQIIAIDPHVRLTENIDTGQWNYQRLTAPPRPPASAPSPGAPLVLPEVLLRNAQVDYSEIRGGKYRELGSLGLEGQLTPAADGDRYHFELQGRGQQGIGPVVSGSFSRSTGQVIAQNARVNFGRDVRTMLPAEVRTWWEAHQLSGQVNIPLLSYTPPRDGKPTAFKVETELERVTLAISPEEWLGRDDLLRRASVRWVYDTLRWIEEAGFPRRDPLHQPFVPVSLPARLASLFDLAPVKLHRVSGSFVFTKDGVNDGVEIRDVGGRVESMENNALVINGRIDGFSPLSSARVTVASRENEQIYIPPAPQLIGSMPRQVREIYAHLRPQGTGSVKIEFVRPGLGARPEVSGEVNITDGSFVFDRFAYPIRKATGRVVFGYDKTLGWDKLQIINLRGMGVENGPNANSVITVDGEMGPLAGDTGVNFRVTAPDVTSEPTLTAAFPQEVRDSLKIFDPAGTGESPKYQGAFTCHVFRPPGKFQRWTIDTDIQLKRASGALAVFPYPLKDVSGRIEIRDGYVDITGLAMKRGESTLNVDGRVRWKPEPPPGAPPVIGRPTTAPAPLTPPTLANAAAAEKRQSYIAPDLKVVARNVPIDDDLLAALPGDRRKWIERIGVGGVLDVEGRVFRKSESSAVAVTDPTTQPSLQSMIDQDFQITLRNGTAWPGEGTFAVADLNGEMRLTSDRLVLSDFHGRRGDAELKGSGTITWVAQSEQPAGNARADSPSNANVPPESRPHIALSATATNLTLDSSLYQALPTTAKEAWDQVRPEGSVDVELAYSGAPSGEPPPPEPIASAAPAALPSAVSLDENDSPTTTSAVPSGFDITIKPRKLSANLKAVPYRLDDVAGSVTVAGSKVTLSDLFARHGDARLKLSGTGVVGATSDWRLKLTANDVPIDDDFRAGVPTVISSMFDSLKMQGLVSFDFSTLALRGDLSKIGATTRPASGPTNAASQPTKPPADFDMDFAVKMVAPSASLDVGVPLTEVDGAVTIAGTVRNGELSEMKGVIDASSLKLAARPGRRLHADMVKPAGRDQLRIGPITGELAGGEIAGDVGLEFPDEGPSRYAMNLQLRNADVKEIAGEAEQDISGQLTAKLALEGNWSDVSARRGRGDVRVQGREMYKIPLVLGLLQITNLALPITSPFNQAEASYGVDGERVTFENISLRSSSMIMQGSGSLDFGTKKVRMTFTTDNPNWPKLPIVGDLITTAKNELLQIHVTGKLQEPKVSASSINTFQTTVDEVLRGDGRK